jgi:hypothetical protein
MQTVALRGEDTSVGETSPSLASTYPSYVGGYFSVNILCSYLFAFSVNGPLATYYLIILLLSEVNRVCRSPASSRPARMLSPVAMNLASLLWGLSPQARDVGRLPIYAMSTRSSSLEWLFTLGIGGVFTLALLQRMCRRHTPGSLQ